MTDKPTPVVLDVAEQKATVNDRSDPRTWDAPTLELVVHAALKAGDVKGVVYALELMVPKDPRRAEELFHILKLGIALAEVSRG